MKKIIMTTAIVILLAACNGNNSNVKEAAESNNSNRDVSIKKETSAAILGKTATITFAAFKVEETFVSDSILHWKIVDEKGVVIEEDEKISFKKINDNQFFLNWIEKSGLTVSQILDPVNGTVTAFISKGDPKSDRGQRSANFLEGKFEFKN